MHEYQKIASRVAEDFGGIFPPHEAFYLQSIIYAADRSNEAFNSFAISVKSGAPDESIVAFVQEGLTHAGSLSRFFWPSKARQGRKLGRTLGQLRDARAEKLRAAFQLSDESPLKDRGIRDALEHFDERLDEYLLSLMGGHIFPRPIVGSISAMNDPAAKFFKMVDPETLCFVLFGKEHRFGNLRDEVFKVLESALRMDVEGSRLAGGNGG